MSASPNLSSADNRLSLGKARHQVDLPETSQPDDDVDQTFQRGHPAEDRMNQIEPEQAHQAPVERSVVVRTNETQSTAFTCVMSSSRTKFTPPEGRCGRFNGANSVPEPTTWGLPIRSAGSGAHEEVTSGGCWLSSACCRSESKDGTVSRRCERQTYETSGPHGEEETDGLSGREQGWTRERRG